MEKVLILSHLEIKELNLKIVDILEEMKKVLKKHALGQTILKPKISLVPREGEFYTAMPGAIKNEYLGLKLIERFSNKDYPGIFGTMFLNDEKTGKLLSILDATWLTSIRTGAVAALTIELLGKKEIKEISIMGLGNTAMATLLCVKENFPNLRKINLLKYKNTHIEFMNKFEYLNLEFNCIENIEEFIRKSEIIVSSITYADKPFIKPEWLRDEVLILPIHTRGWQDCDQYMDKIFTDDYNHTKHFIKNTTGELGEVLIGKINGREKEKNEKIIAYNVGIAIDDIAIAKLIYEKALKEKKGTYLEIGNYEKHKCIF